MAYWMFGFYCSKIMLSLVWSENNIEIKNNRFINAPPYTMAINFDSARGMRNIVIADNIFENIGDYIPEGYIVRNDWTGYNQIDSITPLAGCGVMLEGSDNVEICNNVFKNVLNGVATSSPDALGNFGNFTLHDNIFIGTGNFTWNEQHYSGGWWSGNYTKTKEGMGIAFGMHYAVEPWSSFVERTYKANVINNVNNNTIYKFGYPVVIDYRRNQGLAYEMGVKKAIIENNTIGKNNHNFIILNDEPNVVIIKNNEWIKNAGLFEKHLFTGWNLITIPLHSNFNASSLLAYIPCTIILKWNESMQDFMVYVQGSPYDFSIDDGHGYFVAVNKNTTFFFVAPVIAGINITLLQGWNSLGWFKEEQTNASNIYNSIAYCNIILKWNNSKNDFDVYVPGSPDNFVIEQGNGFFVSVSQQSQWHGEVNNGYG